jgi:hypothetical protein
MLSLFCVVVMTIVFSSCSDDEPFVKPKLSMDESTMSVGEAAGTINVEVVLDKAFSETITVEYALSGTAKEGTAADADYEVVGTLGEVDIAAGQTKANIQLAIKSDDLFEGDETIEIRIKDVDSDQIDITDDDRIVVTITDDDVRAKISFAAATMTTNEDERNITVQVSLDKTVSSDVVATFALSGTAVDSVAGAASNQDNLFSDYQLKGSQTSVTIPAGQTTATLTIKAYSDFYLEDDETIIITLQSAGSQAEIGTIGEITITLDQEDGRTIALFWDESYTTVDMDMFLWIGDPGTALVDLIPIAFSILADFDGPEFVFIPSVVLDATFGVSYIYYEGDVEPMNFEVFFIDFADGEFEPLADQESFAATYNLVNINAWDQPSAPDPAIVQTFDVAAGVYTTPTAIMVPATGSRYASPALPEGFVKPGKIPYSYRMQQLIRR